MNPNPKLRILIIDDEVQIRRFLRINLELQGYIVYEALNGKSGIQLNAQHRPDLIILDLGLPDLDGLVVLQQIREWTQTPVLVLSVQDSDHAKVSALDLGADDYLTKPFSVDELLARLRVAFRHRQPKSETSIFECGRLQVDLAKRLVMIEGNPIKLSPIEYTLLKVMIQHVGKVLTHPQLLREVWGSEYIYETHYLRVYITQLRRKIEEDPSRPLIILTESGVGYRLVDDYSNNR